MKKWWFSTLLGICYLAIFHTWIYCTTHFQVKVFAISLAIFLFLVSAYIYKNYFHNKYDYFVHVAIIADILLEGIFIYPHEDYWFYGCFIGFAVVLILFRHFKGLPKEGAVPKES